MGPSTTNRQAAEKEKVENKRRCMRRQSARFQTYLYSCEIFQFRRGIQVFDVIGSGVVGLRYAREVAKIGSVAVITKAEPHEINKNYAQGNIKAVDLVKPQSLDQQVTSATESLNGSTSSIREDYNVSSAAKKSTHSRSCFGLESLWPLHKTRKAEGQLTNTISHSSNLREYVVVQCYVNESLVEITDPVEQNLTRVSKADDRLSIAPQFPTNDAGRVSLHGVQKPLITVDNANLANAFNIKVLTPNNGFDGGNILSISPQLPFDDAGGASNGVHNHFIAVDSEDFSGGPCIEVHASAIGFDTGSRFFISPQLPINGVGGISNGIQDPYSGVATFAKYHSDARMSAISPEAAPSLGSIENSKFEYILALESNKSYLLMPRKQYTGLCI